jgi:hypothetical protein
MLVVISSLDVTAVGSSFAFSGFKVPIPPIFVPHRMICGVIPIKKLFIS